MIINKDIVAKVRNAWIADQEHPYRRRDKREYPSEEHLAKVLDIAFRASLIREEGVPVRGSLTLLSPDELNSLEIRRRRETPLVLRLSEPRHLDVEVVAKLIFATEADSSSLLVDCSVSGCEVWGIIYWTKKSSPLTQLPVYIPESRHGSPDAPTVELTGNGSLRITRSGYVIGRIEKGDFKTAVPTPFASRAMGMSLFDLFDIKISGQRFSTEEDALKRSVFFQCLEYLLQQIDTLGGGATVIFAPQSSEASIHEFAKFPWKGSGGLELDMLIKAHMQHHQEAKHRFDSIAYLKSGEILQQRLSSLAQLASLDGALMLAPSFEVIGFGVKLNSPIYAGQVCEGPDGFSSKGNVMDFSRYGTRHNSALGFIAAVQGSVGFVASEDGPIRGLAKSSDGVVYCWPDCRLSMFA